MNDLYPIFTVSPKLDLRYNKRFDGREREDDIRYTLFGKCFCGADEGVKHYHRYKEDQE